MKSEVGFDGFVNLPHPTENELRSIFGKYNDLTIFDIGACEGEDSVRYARLFPNARVHAFEPIPKNFQLVKDNVKKYKLSDRIKINEIALSDKDGEAEIHVSSGRPKDKDEDWDYGNKSSSLLKPNKALEVTPWLKFKEKLKIETQTLDSYCNKNKIGSIDLIHMDVQGAELMVLSGARKYLQSISAIWLEVEAVELYKDQPLREDVESFMEKNGFTKLIDTVDTVAGDQLYVNEVALKKKQYLTKKTRVSVVIPTYNRADYISAAIESVLSQDVEKVEFQILLVDDGSTDNTKEIVKKYKEVEFIPIKHVGIPATVRNVGISKATGEFIAFLDSDDFWPADKIRRQISLFDDENTNLVYGQAELVTKDGVPTKSYVVPEKELDYGEDLELLLKSNSIPNSSVIMRTSILKELGGLNESKELFGIEDYAMWLRVALLYPKTIKSVRFVSAYYRQHSENISISDPLTAISRIVRAHSRLLSEKTIDESTKTLIDNRVTADHHAYRAEYAKLHGKPDVSVVMSVYNGERYLKAAIDSILAQTHHNFELILINDGSSDNTTQILATYQDKRLYVVEQTNHGLVYSLNRGCKIAAGDFIARMDADDISTPSRFEKQLEVLIADPAVAVVGSFFAYIDETGSHLGTVMVMPTESIDLKRSLYVVNPFAHGSTMMRKAAWEQAGGYVSTYGPTEDFELWRKIADIPESKFAMIPEILYWYRINPEGISQQKEKVQNQNAQKLIKEQWQKPFIGKGMKSIVLDGKKYQILNQYLGDVIFGVYYYQQLFIMQKLFQKKHFLTGLKHAVALLRLKPNWSRKLIFRSIIGGFLRKIGVKK